MNNKTTVKPPKGSGNIRLGYLPVGSLDIDPLVQREKINERKLDKIRNDYDPSGLGTLTVSERSDGTYVVLDGMHRRLVVKEKEGDEFAVACKIHKGLTLDKEAELFVRLNVQEPASALDLHKARVTQEEPVALALESAVKEHGWTIGTGRPRTISAVKVLESLYITGEHEFEDYGRTLVEDTIGVLTAAWGYDEPKAVSQQLLRAVGDLILAVENYKYHRNKDVDYFDLDLLAEAMRTQFKHGPGGWVVAQRAIVAAGEGPMKKTMRNSLITAYNKKQPLRSKKLPDELRL